jgi:hypothetical protein
MNSRLFIVASPSVAATGFALCLGAGQLNGFPLHHHGAEPTAMAAFWETDGVLDG